MLYRVTDLGTLGGSYSFASAVNESGEVVGQSETPGDNTVHSFRYSNGTMTDLDTFDGSNHEALGINSIGQIVGRTFFHTEQATLDDGNGIRRLGPRDAKSGAWAINDRGEVAGRPVLVQSDSITYLSSQNGIGYAINEHGVVAGYLDMPNGSRHATVFRGGLETYLGTPGGACRRHGEKSNRSPVPEPSSFVLGGIGLAVVVSAVARHRVKVVRGMTPTPHGGKDLWLTAWKASVAPKLLHAVRTVYRR